MNKISAFLLAALMLCMPLVSCANTGDDAEGDMAELAGTYDITVWVSEKEGVAEQFLKQIDAFNKANPGIVINAKVEGVTEADAASLVVADVSTAPDMYSFIQDQLARLVQASALAAPGTAAQDKIRKENDAGAVAAATVNGTIRAYPMTSDNGYFMYYDTSIISESEADSLEAIIAACEKNGKKVRFGLEDAWYTASFFFATGCHSDWTMNEAGGFVSVDDNFNSAEGLIAMKGMQKLTSSKAYDSNANVFTDAGAVITGVWNAEAAEQHFGDNLGATDLPSFTVDGKSYHLGSFSGNKLLGVKPQSDVKRGAVLSMLAQYLTSKECQMERYESFQWGPSNLEAQSTPEVQSNISLAALAKQSAYGKPQGQIHGGWWDTARVLGAKAKSAKTENDLKRALEDYKTSVDKLIAK